MSGFSTFIIKGWLPIVGLKKFWTISSFLPFLKAYPTFRKGLTFLYRHFPSSEHGKHPKPRKTDGWATQMTGLQWRVAFRQARFSCTQWRLIDKTRPFKDRSRPLVDFFCNRRILRLTLVLYCYKQGAFKVVTQQSVFNY